MSMCVGLVTLTSIYATFFTPTSGTARVLEQDECPLLLKRLRMGR